MPAASKDRNRYETHKGIRPSDKRGDVFVEVDDNNGYLQGLDAEAIAEEKRKQEARQKKANKAAEQNIQKRDAAKNDILYKTYNKKKNYSKNKSSKWLSNCDEKDGDSNSGLWKNYKKEWEHLLEWCDESNDYRINKEMGFYVLVQTGANKTAKEWEEENSDETLGQLYNTEDLHIKCKLCRNAKNQPSEFDVDHMKSEPHQAKLRERDSKMEMLTRIVQNDVLDSAGKIVRPACPFPKKPWYMLVKKMHDTSFCPAASIRCLHCGEQHDIPLTQAMIDDPEMERTNKTGDYGHDLYEHDRIKRHKKSLWCYDCEYANDKDAKSFRAEIMGKRARLIEKDRNFYGVQDNTHNDLAETDLESLDSDTDTTDEN